jgi:hypothetical protein
MFFMAFVHQGYTGEWFFLKGTFAKATGLLKLRRGVQEFSLWQLEWVQLVLLVIAAPLVELVFGGWQKFRPQLNFRNQKLLHWCMNVCALLPLMYLQYVRHQETVSLFLYYDQGMPIVFLGVAAFFVSPGLDTGMMSDYLFRRLGLLFFLLAVVIFAVSTNWLTPLRTQVAGAVFYSFLASALVLTRLYFEKPWRPRAAVLALFLAVFFHNNMSPSGTEFISSDKSVESPHIGSRAEALDAAFNWIQLVKRVDPGRAMYLWYDARGAQSYLRGFSAASHLWQARIFNEDFPSVNSPMGEVGTRA